MSDRRLPAEILDHVVDHLHDTQGALRNCCLVSKSWVSRTRKHLFADIKFYPKSLQSWKETFPDPSTSPARYAKKLHIVHPQVVTAADAEPGGWIRGFSRVVHFKVGSSIYDLSKLSFAPFHGFSPVIKSLSVVISAFPASWIFNLILSFPLLEDLSLFVHDNRPGDGFGVDEMPIIQPSSPRVLTGSLDLRVLGRGIGPFTCRLLSLPGGIHFRKLSWTWFREEELSPIMGLVEACSHTLETLNVTCNLAVGSESAPIDLSRPPKLKHVVFRCRRLSPGWILKALRTIVPNQHHLEQISLHAPHIPSRHTHPGPHLRRRTAALRESDYMQWLELDRLLAQFWESHSIRPKVVYHPLFGDDGEVTGGRVYSLFPEVISRGIVDFSPSDDG